jgi:mono/diheme cytochrome c family protein
MRKKWILQWAIIAAASLWFPFEADAQNSSGEQDFAKLCLGCHGESATGTDRGPALINSRSLRNRSEKQIQQIIRSGTEGGMPTFPLPQEQLQPLARWVHSLNASASNLELAGNVTAGEQFKQVGAAMELPLFTSGGKHERGFYHRDVQSGPHAAVCQR